MTAVTVLLVRHGEVENPGSLRYGCLPGFGLSARGREQAEATGRHLRALGEPVTRVVSSPLERARETAEILREALGLEGPVAIEPRVIEASSRFDGLRRRGDAAGHIARMFERERSHESPEAVAQRVSTALVELAGEHSGGIRSAGALLVVSHQLPIVYARAAFERGLGHPRASLWTRLDPWGESSVRCGYASVTTLSIDGPEGAVRGYWSPPQG